MSYLISMKGSIVLRRSPKATDRVNYGAPSSVVIGWNKFQIHSTQRSQRRTAKDAKQFIATQSLYQ